MSAMSYITFPNYLTYSERLPGESSFCIACSDRHWDIVRLIDLEKHDEIDP